MFQGVDSERGVAWRDNDLLALRQFLRIGLEKSGPDHSTIARPVRVDATTLAAKAALRSIVRRDFEEGYLKGKNSNRNW
jgi:IS5 family transposase